MTSPFQKLGFGLGRFVPEEAIRKITEWRKPQSMRLLAGEMTAQEERTARAILDAALRELAAAPDQARHTATAEALVKVVEAARNMENNKDTSKLHKLLLAIKAYDATKRADSA